MYVVCLEMCGFMQRVMNDQDKQNNSGNKTDVERRQTLRHPRSINPNMINHVPQQLHFIF